MSRKVGASPEKTKKSLIESATTEFLSMGYRKASLRDICGNAGVTTGALYFFFDSKEALFNEIITPVLSEIKDTVEAYYDAKLSLETSDGDSDLEFGTNMVKYYYDNKDICDIILSNRNYPVIRDFFDEAISYMDDRMTRLQKLRAQAGAGRKPINRYTRHWLSHLQIDSFLNVLTHTPDLESAINQVAVTVTFIRAGYHAII
ncbi:MAG: TetR/AcrR family transcriptional regulator [Oscillospiraceae bacterium]|nr:TetR/AcrR family transcriptional regulator [Oscillospiraceae bacterium]